MSRHYLLDGYNIIKQIQELADLSLQDGREALLRWLKIQRPQGSVHNSVTVVFDGSAEHFGYSQGGLAKVVFSQNGSADDVIRQAVEDSAAPKNIVVVSNDKGIVLYVRALGAQIMSVAEFVGHDFTPSGERIRKKVSKPGVLGKNIPLSAQEKINKEFRKLWGCND